MMQSDESTFVARFKRGALPANDIFRYIHDWHAMDIKEPLHVFLGFTKEQFIAWGDGASVADVLRFIPNTYRDTWYTRLLDRVFWWLMHKVLTCP